MRFRKPILRFILFLIIPLLMSSCISINRQIKLNRDGTGKEIMKITFMKEFYDVMASMSSLMDSSRREGFLDSLYSDEVFENKTAENYDTVAGLRLIDLSSATNPDSSKTFTIDYEFDNVSKIGSSLSHINENDDKYVTDVSLKEDGNKVYFLYEYRLKEDGVALSEDAAADSLARDMKESMSKMFEGGNFSFEVELPYNVISSNSNSRNGNILKWEFPMTEIMLSEKIRLEAEMEK
ncbi:MAG TPA: hypothetical protein DCY06_13530 [Bacteroidetes bacterium]|nr:hypothetical protein [Bacteroidota bacterium]HRJ98691.1 hypothetical protein [Ignavibacteria bacterium]